MKLSKKELQELRRYAKKRFALKLFIYVNGIFFPILYGYLFGYHWWIAMVLAIMMVHGTQLMHQLTHGVYNRSTDRLIGQILGWPMIENYSEYRISHLRHHRYIGMIEYRCHPSRQPQGYIKFAYQILEVFKLISYLKTLRRMLMSWFCRAEIPENNRLRLCVCHDYQFMQLGYVAIFILVDYYDQWDFLINYWIVPLAIASILHVVVEYTVHAGCDMDSTDSLRNSCSIETNLWMRWFTNYGCYHAEHHEYMHIPVDALHSLRAKIAMKCRYSYRGYYKLFQSLLFSGRHR